MNYSDPVNLQRMPKRSATWYKDFIQKSTVNISGTVSILEESSDMSAESESGETFWKFLLEKLANLQHPALVAMI